ncbi:MAG TPA: hypothetical protein VIL34_16830 [Actinopolymorphaceae bacterium]
MTMTVGLVVAGVVLAFIAGRRYQHSKRTWSDWRVARTGERNFRKMRWSALKAAVIAAILLGAYLIGIVRLGLDI